MLPDDVVRAFQGRISRGSHHLVDGGHELGDLGVHVHAGHAVVTGSDDAQQVAVRGAVVRDGDGGEAVLRLQIQHVLQGLIRGQVGCRRHEAGLIALDPRDHCGFILHGLRSVNERDAALFRQRDRHAVVGDGLHDRADQRDVERDRRLFLPFLLYFVSAVFRLTFCGTHSGPV